MFIIPALLLNFMENPCRCPRNYKCREICIEYYKIGKFSQLVPNLLLKYKVNLKTLEKNKLVLNLDEVRF